MRCDEALKLVGDGEPRAEGCEKEALYSAERQRQRLSVAEDSARPPGAGATRCVRSEQTAEEGGADAVAEIEMGWAESSWPQVVWETEGGVEMVGDECVSEVDTGESGVAEVAGRAGKARADGGGGGREWEDARRA